MNDIYKFIKYFHYKTDNKYKDYIDWRVYSKNRLFRIVGSKCPGQQNFSRKLNDYHKLIKGNLEDTIIQNYIDLYEVKLDYNNYLKNKHIKGKYTKKEINDLSNKIYNNFDKLMKEINSKNKKKFSPTPKNKWDNFKYQYESINIINNIINSIKNKNNNEENIEKDNKEENNIKLDNNEELLQLLKIMKDNIYNNINTNKKINNMKYSINIYQIINNVIIIIMLLILMIYILFKKN